MIRLFTCLAVCIASAAVAEVRQGPKNVPEFEPAFENQTRAPVIRDTGRLSVTQIAGGLTHPWGIAVLPDAGYLVTERVGRLNHVAADGKVTRIKGLPKIFVEAQGGMLDVAVADDFATTRRIFITYSAPSRGRSVTAAATGVLSEGLDRLSDVREIFRQNERGKKGIHYGSRIVVGGGHAYITVGDRGEPDLAQDLRSTTGVVVRVALDGEVPADNPFQDTGRAAPEIWSYGHRNPQGAALNPATGDLWTLEHGPAGGDELNRIKKGANFGWPVISYGENYGGSPVGQGLTQADGLEQPRYYWDPVIAPGDFTFYQGDVFPGWEGDVVAASLRPGGIVRLKLDGDRITHEARYLGNMGRIRDVDVDRDGALLVITDDPNGGLYRVVPR